MKQYNESCGLFQSGRFTQVLLYVSSKSVRLITMYSCSQVNQTVPYGPLVTNYNLVILSYIDRSKEAGLY